MGWKSCLVYKEGPQNKFDGVNLRILNDGIKALRQNSTLFCDFGEACP